jgi:hypothetical protein
VPTPELHLLGEDCVQKRNNIGGNMRELSLSGKVALVALKVTVGEITDDEHDFLPVVVKFQVSNVRVNCGEDSKRPFCGLLKTARRKSLSQLRNQELGYLHVGG